jgi:hypothetical protein
MYFEICKICKKPVLSNTLKLKLVRVRQDDVIPPFLIEISFYEGHLDCGIYFKNEVIRDAKSFVERKYSEGIKKCFICSIKQEESLYSYIHFKKDDNVIYFPILSEHSGCINKRI